MVSAGSQLTGVAVQLWGDLVIFDPLTAGFAGSAGLTYALVGGLVSGDPLTPSHLPGVARRRPAWLSGHLTSLDSRLA